MVTLQRVNIKSYRSCLNTEFKPHPNLTALIGPNGSGKTNILSAIRLLRSISRTGKRRFFEKVPSNSSPVTLIKSTFVHQKINVEHAARLKIDTDEHNMDEVSSADESWYSWGLTKSRKRIKIPLEFLHESSPYPLHLLQHFEPKFAVNFELTKQSKIFRVLQEVCSFIYGIRYYSASQFTNPSQCPISFEIETEGSHRRGISITGHKKFLFDVYRTYSDNTKKFNEFLTLVNQTGVGLIDNITFEEIKVSSSEYQVTVGGRVRKRQREKLLVVPQFTLGKNTLSPSQLSEGTFKTIALLFYLVTDSGSLLLIEEPEVCVHHGLLESIVELIRVYSRNKQIIMSTHSDAVLDQLEAENVFSVKNDLKVGTQINGLQKSLGNTELAALKNYLQSEGTLGEYWRRGGLEDNE